MPAAICVISGTICNVDGTPSEGAQIRATVKSTLDDQGGQIAGGGGITTGIV